MSGREHLLLLLGAALYALALPPFDFAAGAWVALVPLLHLAEAKSPGRAALLGAVAGFYTSWAVTWWLPRAIAAYFQSSLLLGAASISVAYVLAVSTAFGAFAWVASAVRERSPALRAVAIPAAWTAAELLRARGLDDPWALLGYTQHSSLGLIQVAALTGVYGVSFLVALGNVAIAGVVARREGGRIVALAAGILILGVWGAGEGVVEAAGVPSGSVRVAVVQPQVPPAYAWTQAYAGRQLASTLRLTRESVADDVDLVVWPENSVTFYPEREPFVRDMLEDLATRLGAALVFGAPRHDGVGVYNSARLVRPDGTWSHYDKQRLVPFAEAPAPFEASASETDAAMSPRHFRAGTTPGVLDGPPRLGVSICHELLYPETMLPAVAAGAELLVNVANDGWLDGGYGVASRQHFAMGIYRAVESRRPLVRAATQGVSGIVDPWGRVTALGTTQPVVRGVVAPMHVLTPYVRWGDWFAGTCALLVVGVLVPGLAPRRRRAAVPASQPL